VIAWISEVLEFFKDFCALWEILLIFLSQHILVVIIDIKKLISKNQNLIRYPEEKNYL